MLRFFPHGWSEPSQEIKTALTGPTTHASKGSREFIKSATYLNVVTLFFKKEPKGGKMAECIPSVNFGQHSDEGHSTWHNTDETPGTHYHLFKDGYSLITPSELECIFKNFKQYDISQNTCLNGKWRCTITDSDSHRVIEEYRRYYEANPEIQAKWQKQMQDAYSDSIKKASYSLLGIFLKSLTATFSQLYITPYLIQQGYNAEKIKASLDAINSAMTLALSLSPEKMLMEFIIRQLLKITHDVLFKNPDNPATQQIFSNILIPLENLILTLSLLSKATPKDISVLGVEMMAAELGTGMAMGLVHMLPKLRKEGTTPDAENKNTEKALPAEKNTPDLPRTMRKRR